LVGIRTNKKDGHSANKQQFDRIIKGKKTYRFIQPYTPTYEFNKENQ